MLGAALPFSASAISIIAVFLLALFFIEGNFKEKFKYALDSKVLLSILLFFILHIIGLFWAEEPVDPFKSLIFFLLPFTLIGIRSDYLEKGLAAFLLGMFILEIGIYYLIIINWDLYIRGAYEDFYWSFGRNIYNPFLAISIGFLLNAVLSGDVKGVKKVIFLFFTTTATLNMFMTGGKSGQIGFIFIWCFAAIYNLSKEPRKLFVMIISILIMFSLAVVYSPIMNKRYTEAFDEAKFSYAAPLENVNSGSTGTRINQAIHSYALFSEQPIFGHGTGSFKNAFEDYAERQNVKVLVGTHPHNHHLLIAVQFGLIGLFVFWSIFIAQLSAAKTVMKKNGARAMAYTLPIFMLIICFYDAYIWSHYMQTLYAFLIVILYFRSCKASLVEKDNIKG